MIYVSANLNTIFGLLWENCLLIHHICVSQLSKSHSYSHDPHLPMRASVCVYESHFYEPETDKQEKIDKKKVSHSNGTSLGYKVHMRCFVRYEVCLSINDTAA